MWVRSLGWEDSLEKGMATQSIILTWRIPWAEEPGGLQSVGSQRVEHNWRDLKCTWFTWYTSAVFSVEFFAVLIFYPFFLLGDKDGSKVTTVVATPGQGPDRPQEVSYTDTKVIGNGSFGVVYQAKLCDSGELVAIKKVLQDKRFKVRPSVVHVFFVAVNTCKQLLFQVFAFVSDFIYWTSFVQLNYYSDFSIVYYIEIKFTEDCSIFLNCSYKGYMYLKCCERC